MPAADLETDNAFWDFSRAVYSALGVARECLAVQDRCDIDVNILLFCAWIAHARRVALTVGDVAEIEKVVTAWHETIVKPLRAVRRALKEHREVAVAGLRDRIKADELEAEKLEQAMLFAFAEWHWPERAGAPESPTSNLDIYLRKHGCADEFAAGLLRSLVAAVRDLG